MKTTYINRFLATIVMAMVSSASGWAISTPNIYWDDNNKIITLACATEGATIYFTVDGTTPTTSSYRYKEPIVVNRAVQLRAIAVKGGETSSVNSINQSGEFRFLNGQFYYRLKDYTLENEVEVTSRTSGIYEGDLAIPPSVTHGGVNYAVTRIGNGAFDNADQVTSITLPNTVTSIGYTAFAEMDKITELDVPASVKAIENRAFSSSKFTKITLHEGLETIGEDAFGYNKNLTSLYLPSTLKTIGGGALRDCSFYSITIPDGVTSISGYTFYNCQSLVSVKLPATLATIPDHMFSNCSALRSITIPSTVKSIGEAAFWGCAALTSIVIPDGVETLGNGICDGCNSLLSATIGEGITTIPNYAFRYCVSLSTVSLPSTLTTIANSSFNECSSLTSITIPENVTSIEKYAFTKCSKLTSVYALPTTPPTMSNDNDGNAFYDALERATLYVKTAALSNYKNNVRWDEFQTKQTFDQMACAQPTFALADYVLTISTTTADATIYYTTDGSAPTTASTQYTAPIYLMKNDTIRAIAVKEGLENSAISEFMKSNYTVAAPTAMMDEHFVVTIDCEAANIEGFPEAEVYYLLDESWSEPYYTDSRWKLYEGPIQLEHPQYVHMYAKRDGWLTSRQASINCYSDYKLATPGVYWKEETQKAYVADYDVHFANATVHYTIDGTTPTADSPVYNPEDSIFIDHNLTVRAIAMRKGFFDSYMGSYEITGLTTKFVVDDYTYRQIDNNAADEVEITSNINSSKKYSGHVVIPREVTVKVGNTEKTYRVTRIGAGAFSRCSELTGVTLHDGIKSIGAEAFYECYQLAQITLPKNLEEIERYAFYHCNQLQEIDIPGSVKVIRENAFCSCGNLKTLTLHEGLETIENGAFYQCKMTSLTLPNSLKTLGKSAFIYCSALATVKMDCQITEIMSETFSGCESLSSITFPSKLKSIGDYAFANCKALPTVSFPEGFTSIGHGSFTNCFTLTTVVFPESLTTISEIAFERCNSLRTITLPQNLQTIQGAAFRYSALESVYSLATTPPKQGIYDGVYAFHGLTDTATLYVKAEDKDAYNSDLRWSLFTNTQAIEAVPSAQPSFFYDSQTYLLSITATDPSAAIYYTRDNSEPTTSSTLYTEPFLLMENDTVKAIAVSAGLGASLVSEFRQANLTVPTPTISFNDDTFVVTLNTEAPDIEGFPETRYYYLLNESDNGNIIPLTDAGWQPLEGNTLQLTRPHFVHIYAVRDGWLSSAQTYKDYYYNYRLYAPQIGWDRTTRTFSLWFYYPNDPASTGDFYYTLDGSEPTKENGILYTEPFTIDRKLTLNVRTFADKHFSSDLATYKVTDAIETKFIKEGIYYRFSDYTVVNEVEVTNVNANSANYTGDITIPETVTYNNKEYRVVGIYENAFNGATVTSVTLPSTIQYISNYAFNQCKQLTSIMMKSGVKTIGNAAFNRCSSLTDVEIPATVESLGSEAFRDCYALQRVTLHDGITSLGSSCFRSCSKLSSVNLPTTLTSIGESCFYACSELRTLAWPASVTTIDRYVFYGAGITHLTLPETVTSIGNDAIRQCKSLQAITLPAGLKTLGNDAFAFDEALTSIVIPEGVTELPSELFVYCNALSSVQLPSTLKVIGGGAFRECPKLTSIVLPESLTNINDRAFENCSGLKSIYSLAVEPPTIGNDATFAVVKGQATVYVNPSSVEAYKEKQYWDEFVPRVVGSTQVATEQPTFVLENYKLALSSLTPNAAIYYTRGGAEPTTSSLRYKEPLIFTRNDTVRAIAIAEGMAPSPIAEYSQKSLKVATPTAAISGDFVVTLSCEAPNVEGMPKTNIYYNQNRTETTAGSEWTLYTEPFKMYTANYIHVKAVREGWIDSDISHNDYYTNYYMAKPTIAPQYTSISYMPADTTVTMSHSKNDAQIYYTLDGSDPNVSGVLYTAPVKLTHNSIVTAIAKRAGAINSDPEQREYKWFTASTPTITVEHLAAVMTVEKPQHARIYYTLDNSTPTAESKLYTEPVALTQDCKIKAIAIADDWNDSSVGTFNSTTGFVKKNYTVVTPAFNSKQVIDGVMKENADSVLTITISTAGATIYYTLDGSTPTINSSKYENGIKLTENCKVRAFAVKEDLFNSEQIEADVEWLQVKQPHISFNGKYVEMSVDTEDAVIYYTIDGTNPDTKSKAYQKPFILEAEETSVKAIAVRANWNNSEYSSLTYNPGKNYCEAPGITRVAGSNKIQMTTRTEGATIYYTIDGLNPTVNSTAYTAEVEVTENCIVKAMAVESQLYDSEVASYTVDWFRATQPTITSDGIFVSITSTQENAKIYYTLDGTDPTTNSSLYEGTLTMKSTCTIKAIAAKDNFNSSTVAVLNYYSTENTCATPIFAKAGNNVSITSAPEDGTTIYYTTDGSTPTTGSEIFTAPIEVIQNGTIKALAVNPKLFQSEIGEYEVNWFKVETPVISQNGSVVSITCSTPNTTIYYSFEGDPFVDGTPYSGPVTLVDNRTLQVVAMRANFNNSEIATLTPDLFVCDPVTFSYNGRYLQMETTEGMTILFTTDGSKPTGESEAYTAPVDINALCTVRAIATRKDFRDSQETSYTVDYLYNGEEVSLNEAGKLEEVFQWMGGTENLETLPVKGKINNDDLTFIRNVKALRYLDLSEATYEGDKIPDEAFANLPLLSISIPKQVTSVGEHLFKGCENLAAIVWNADITVPQSVIDDIKNPNMLLYVNSRIYAPTNFQGNLISGGEATSITLTDIENGGNFCCPQRFYTQRISYTHNYSQTTKSGSTQGWETLALPFDVQTITHENRGAMAPFGKEEDMAAYKPFWLYELQETGFTRSAEIKAYTPYIVSMPNDPDYADDYILAGKVTFAATGTYVEADTTKVTMKGSVRFTPSMQHQEKGESVLAINKEAYTDDNGTFHESGSMFVRNSRDVRPFEAYALVNSAGVKAMSIGDYLWGGATDIRDAEMKQLKEIGKNKGIYDMSGKLLSPDSNYFKEKLQHRNIFIINGQKTLVK